MLRGAAPSVTTPGPFKRWVTPQCPGAGDLPWRPAWSVPTCSRTAHQVGARLRGAPCGRPSMTSARSLPAICKATRPAGRVRSPAPGIEVKYPIQSHCFAPAVRICALPCHRSQRCLSIWDDWTARGRCRATSNHLWVQRSAQRQGRALHGPTCQPFLLDSAPSDKERRCPRTRDSG